MKVEKYERLGRSYYVPHAVVSFITFRKKRKKVSFRFRDVSYLCKIKPF